jgi:hypothetical protein
MPKEEVSHVIHNEVYLFVLKNLVNKAWKWRNESTRSNVVFICFITTLPLVYVVNPARGMELEA